MERARPRPRGYDCKARDGDRTTSRPGPAPVPISGGRAGIALIGGLAVVGATMLTGCDSTVGIPDDSSPGPAVAATTPARPATTTAPPPSTAALPPVPADAPPVGAVAELPAAVTAVRRWAADLRSSSLTELQDKCWTLAPRNVAEMYADEQAVLTALARPGALTEGRVVWQSATTVVSIDRAAAATGYACPRVAAAGTEIEYNDADARHTVRRYLARFVGTPLDAADKEADYPLVCKANAVTWDPEGSGRPVRPPLADNPGALTGTTAFADQEIRSEQLSAAYTRVLVPVTNSAGVTQTRTFTLSSRPDGYCIGEVSP